MFKQFVVGLALVLIAGQALASEVYVPAAAAEFPSSNACVPTARVGANGRNYTVVACQPGQYFFATLSVPQDATTFAVMPVVSWVTQSTDISGTVCWNLQSEGFPPTAASVPTTYDNFAFLGDIAMPSGGQVSNGANRMNITGYTSQGGIDPSTGLSAMSIHANSGNNGFTCTTQSANLDCRSRPWVVKISRSASCGTQLGSGTADFVAARLTVN